MSKKKIIIFSAWALLMVLSLFEALKDDRSDYGDREVIAALAAMSGSVQTRYGESSIWDYTSLGSDLHRDEIIATGEKSKATVTFIDNTTLELDSNTQLALTLESGSGGSNYVVTLLKGTVRSSSKTSTRIGRSPGREKAQALQNSPISLVIRSGDTEVVHNPNKQARFEIENSLANKTTKLRVMGGQVEVSDRFSKTAPKVLTKTVGTVKFATSKKSEVKSKFNIKEIATLAMGKTVKGGEIILAAKGFNLTTPPPTVQEANQDYQPLDLAAKLSKKKKKTKSPVLPITEENTEELVVDKPTDDQPVVAPIAPVPAPKKIKLASIPKAKKKKSKVKQKIVPKVEVVPEPNPQSALALTAASTTPSKPEPNPQPEIVDLEAADPEPAPTQPEDSEIVLALSNSTEAGSFYKTEEEPDLPNDLLFTDLSVVLSYGIPLLKGDVISESSFTSVSIGKNAGTLDGLRIGGDFIPTVETEIDGQVSKFGGSRYNIGYAFAKDFPSFIERIDFTPKLSLWNYEVALPKEEDGTVVTKEFNPANLGAIELELGAQFTTYRLLTRGWVNKTIGANIDSQSLDSTRAGLNMLVNAFGNRDLMFSVLAFTFYEKTSVKTEEKDPLKLNELEYNQAYGGGGLSVSW